MSDTDYNIENFSDKELKKKEDDILKTRGTAGSNRKEPIPTLNTVGVEKVVSQYNSWIVLGKDRSSSPISGKVGHGSTQASSIDIVVGRKNNTKDKPPSLETAVDPDFFDDAGRIYLTQKGDIDNYFGIASGTENNLTSQEKSGIGIKADHVRLYGREHIKIVTGQSQNSGAQEDLNSLGKTIGKVGRIDFIAGNYNDFVSNPSKLQPLVKGENLVELQKELLETLRELVGHITTNTTEIMTIWTTLGSFIAPATTLSATPPVLIAFQTMCSAKSMYIGSAVIPAHKATNLGINATQINYLEVVDGSQYINSEHVFTT